MQQRSVDEEQVSRGPPRSCKADTSAMPRCRRPVPHQQFQNEDQLRHLHDRQDQQRTQIQHHPQQASDEDKLELREKPKKAVLRWPLAGARAARRGTARWQGAAWQVGCQWRRASAGKKPARGGQPRMHPSASKRHLRQHVDHRQPSTQRREQGDQQLAPNWLEPKMEK